MKCIKLKQLKLAPAPKVIANIFAQFARFSVSSVAVPTNTSAADCWTIPKYFQVSETSINSTKVSRKTHSLTMHVTCF